MSKDSKRRKKGESDRTGAAERSRNEARALNREATVVEEEEKEDKEEFARENP